MNATTYVNVEMDTENQGRMDYLRQALQVKSRAAIMRHALGRLYLATKRDEQRRVQVAQGRPTRKAARRA